VQHYAPLAALRGPSLAALRDAAGLFRPLDVDTPRAAAA
jgi:hypothetical protein